MRVIQNMARANVTPEKSSLHTLNPLSGNNSGSQSARTAAEKELWIRQGQLCSTCFQCLNIATVELTETLPITHKFYFQFHIFSFIDRCDSLEKVFVECLYKMNKK